MRTNPPPGLHIISIILVMVIKNTFGLNNSGSAGSTHRLPAY